MVSFAGVLKGASAEVILKNDPVHDEKGRFAKISVSDALHSVAKFVKSEAYKSTFGENKNGSDLSGVNRISKAYEKEVPKQEHKDKFGGGYHIHSTDEGVINAFHGGNSNHWTGHAALGTGVPFDVHPSGEPVTKPSKGVPYVHAEFKPTAKIVDSEHLNELLPKITESIEQGLKSKGISEDRRNALNEQVKKLFQDHGLAASVLGMDAVRTYTQNKDGTKNSKILVTNKNALIVHHTTVKKEADFGSAVDINGSDLSNSGGIKMPEQAQINTPAKPPRRKRFYSGKLDLK